MFWTQIEPVHIPILSSPLESSASLWTFFLCLITLPLRTVISCHDYCYHNSNHYCNACFKNIKNRILSYVNNAPYHQVPKHSKHRIYWAQQEVKETCTLNSVRLELVTAKLLHSYHAYYSIPCYLTLFSKLWPTTGGPASERLYSVSIHSTNVL